MRMVSIFILDSIETIVKFRDKLKKKLKILIIIIYSFNEIRFSNENFLLQRKQLELYSLAHLLQRSSETLLNTCVP